MNWVNISELRVRMGYSQLKLAELVGVTQYCISYLESGSKSNPSIKIMAALFKALSMSKEEIKKFLDIHAKLNGCVSYNIADFIMENEKNLRNAFILVYHFLSVINRGADIFFCFFYLNFSSVAYLEF